MGGERGTKMRNIWISSSTDFALFSGSEGSCGKLLLDRWEQSLETEIQLLTKAGWVTDHLNNVHTHKSLVPDEMGLRVPRELAGVTATLSSPNGHRDGECPWWLEKGQHHTQLQKGKCQPSRPHSLPRNSWGKSSWKPEPSKPKYSGIYYPESVWQNYLIIAILCFLCSSSALQILLLLPSLPWNGVFLFHICNYNKHGFRYMRQKYIFHLNLGVQRCWIHSGHLLEVTLGMKSVVEEEHGVSLCSFVC